MIQTYFAVFPQDSANDTFVFRRFHENGRLVIMDEYQDLACGKCRKLDEKAALARGVNDGVMVNSKRPFLGSSDDFYLLDNRGKEIFSRLLPNLIDYYRIPSGRFHVASAKASLQPQETDSGFRFGRDRCQVCGRLREVVWAKASPTIPGTPQFVAINLESIFGARENWLVSRDVADELRKASSRLTGMVLVPKDIDDGRPS